MSEAAADSARKKNIAIMVPTLSHSVEYSFTLGIQSQLPSERFNLLFMSLGWIEASTANSGQAALLHETLHFSDLDGILIYSAGITNRVRSDYISQITDCYPQIPIVNVGNINPTLPSVVVDNQTPFREFAHHLVKTKGCSQIAFVGGPEGNFDALQRLAGFEQGLAECGQTLAAEYCWPGQFSVSSGGLAVRHHYGQNSPPPEAIVCANDLSAIGVMNQLIDMGIRIPEQCLVVGFDDLEYSKVIPIPLSTGRYPIFEMGATAARHLIDWLEGRQPVSVTEVPSSVVFRTSSGDEGDPRSQIVKLRERQHTFYSRDSNSDRLLINRAINRGRSINQALTKIAPDIIEIGCAQLYYLKYDVSDHSLTDIVFLNGEDVTHLPKKNTLFKQLSIQQLHSQIKNSRLNWVLSPVQSELRLFGLVLTAVVSSELDFAEYLANEFCKKSENILLSRETQALKNQVIQTEQMATLGRLVSGLAHELNTPIGVSLVAASNLADETATIQQLDADQKMTKSAFDRFLETCDETQKILLSSLKRTADLVSSFKKISVDQHLDEKREINLSEYLDEVLVSLRPKLRQAHIQIVADLEADVVVTTIPGAWAQLLTNLVLNAITHGYDDGKREGVVTLSLRRKNHLIEFSVSDTGIGITKENMRRIYEPFFTTRRASGGTGLGMHIVFNIVSQKLMGHIQVKSKHQDETENKSQSGTAVIISVPLH